MLVMYHRSSYISKSLSDTMTEFSLMLITIDINEMGDDNLPNHTIQRD